MNNQDKNWTNLVMNSILEKSPKDETHLSRQLLLDFLKVLDSLDRLVTIAHSSAKPQPESGGSGWLSHLQALQKQLLDVFEHAGVTFFDCAGQSFDPNRHESVKAVKRHDIKDYTIIEEVSRGCEWHGEILRYAKVVVARNTE